MEPATRTSRPRRLTVADVMTREVVTAAVGTPFKELERMMWEHHVSGIPVIDSNGTPIGVVSEADLLLKREAADEPLGGWSPHARKERTKAAAVTALGLMSAPAITTDAGAPLALAARLLRHHGIKRLPVVENGRLVGIVSRADVLKTYLRSDDDIRNDVLDGVIRGTMWMDPAQFDVAVADGVVRISGEVDRRSVVRILNDLVRGVEGVVGVDSTLTFAFDDRDVGPSTELHVS
jgi:CBS domain-containing protein